jgi:membrane fusion protein (multidrug efflux system)
LAPTLDLRLKQPVSQTAPLSNVGAAASASTDQVWVTVEMNETARTHVKPGERVGISVDTHTSDEGRGIIESICPGSGLKFLILPTQTHPKN